MSRSPLFAVCLAIVSLHGISSAQGQSQLRKPVNNEATRQQETLRIWGEHDSYAAFAHLESQGTPEVVAVRYGKLLQHLHNERKDLPEMIMAARAGIDFALRQAKVHEASDEKATADLRGQAKAMAYNLGANCWPGWKEPGITIGPTELTIGLDAARLNLRLGIELQRPAEPLAHAHWLLGAQLLAAKEYDAASAEFIKSAQKFAAANKPTEERMALAYEKLTRRLQRAEDAAARETLQAALAALEKLDNDDARFFAEQIRTAEEVFAK